MTNENNAATLKAAQGGVTEAINWSEFWNRISQNFDSADVDKVRACYKAALSAQQGQGEAVADRVAKAIADATGHGMREKCESQARAAIAALSAQQGEVVAWRFKLDDGSFQYGTAGHEVRIPRPIVEATPLYTTPPAQQGQGAAWDARGGSLWLDREQWGVVIDALIEHRASAAKRKNGNPDSTSDVRADECGDLIGKITSAAKSITTPPAQPAERVPEESYRGVPYRVLGKAFQRVLADPNVLWRDNGGAQEFIDRVQEETRLSLLASPAPSPARGDGGEG